MSAPLIGQRETLDYDAVDDQDAYDAARADLAAIAAALSERDGGAADADPS